MDRMSTVCVLIVGKDADTEDERKTSSNKVDVGAVPSDTEDDDDDVVREELGSECEELVLRIVRDAGTGLGISVAGGVGTTAFKEGDEVATSAVLCRHRHFCLKETQSDKCNCTNSGLVNVSVKCSV